MSHAHELSQLQAELDKLQAELKALKQESLHKQVSRRERINDTEDALDVLDDRPNVFKRIADIPGVRTPAWYRVDVPFTFGDTQTRFSRTEISPVGPFICTQIQCYFLNSDTDTSHYRYVTAAPTFPTTTAAGRTLPPSSFWDVVGSMTANTGYGFNGNYLANTFRRNLSALDIAQPARFQRGFGWNYPEFNIQIEIAGSNRYWTGNQLIPAAAFYGYLNPLYAGFEGVVENTDSIVVHAQPSTATVNLTGSLVAEFHGYHINAHVNVKQLMGY